MRLLCENLQAFIRETIDLALGKITRWEEPAGGCGRRVRAWSGGLHVTYIFDGFSFDPARRCLAQGERTISLTPKMSDLLLLFLKNPGRILTRQNILDQLWPDVAVVEEALTFQVSELRKVLGERSDLIRTIRGEGYRWEGERAAMVEDEPAAEPAAELAVALEAARPVRSRRRLLMLVSLLVLCSAVVTVILILSIREGRPGENWVQVFSDDFERSEVGPSYGVSSGRWGLAYGALRGEGSGFVNIDVLQHFGGEVRVELDAVVPRASAKREIAVFLCRDTAEVQDGYYLGAGADYRVAAIDRNGIEVAVALMSQIEPDRPYHVTIQRRRDLLEMSIDGTTVVRYQDPIPLNPAEHGRVRIGTYDGILRVDNLRISRSRMPGLVSPTAIGDRLFDRGEYETAQSEYEQVMRDHAGTRLAGEAIAKVGLCLMARGEYAAAEEAFRKVEGSAAEEAYVAVARLGIGRALAETGAMDDAYRHLAHYRTIATDDAVLYGIASELLNVASLFRRAGKTDRCLETEQFVVERFPSLPLIVERAALKLAASQPDDERFRAALAGFLAEHKRPGKPRYEAQHLLGLVSFMRGDFERSLELYGQMQREFEQINPRFSLTGLWCEALVLSVAGRVREASTDAQRISASLPGDPLPARLHCEWDVLAKWLDADGQAATAALDAEIRTPHGTALEQELDRLDLAVLLLEAGQTTRANDLLTHALESPTPGVAETAGMLLGRRSIDDYLSGGRMHWEMRSLYAGDRHWLSGRRTEAAAAYQSAIRESTWHLSPAFCRAYVRMQSTVPATSAPR